jgi:hypothetical protein
MSPFNGEETFEDMLDNFDFMEDPDAMNEVADNEDNLDLDDEF